MTFVITMLLDKFHEPSLFIGSNIIYKNDGRFTLQSIYLILEINFYFSRQTVVSTFKLFKK